MPPKISKVPAYTLIWDKDEWVKINNAIHHKVQDLKNMLNSEFPQVRGMVYFEDCILTEIEEGEDTPEAMEAIGTAIENWVALQ